MLIRNLNIELFVARLARAELALEECQAFQISWNCQVLMIIVTVKNSITTGLRDTLGLGGGVENL